MQSYKLNFLFFICFFPFLLFGQDPYYINYDTKDGLPSSEVYDVKVDSNGIVWFTTDRGICSYNGYEFETYTTKDGLSNNTHLISFISPSGQIWFIAIDGTLTILENGKFRPFKWNENLKKIANGSWLDWLAWDLSGKLYLSFRANSKNINDHIFSIENGQIIENSFSELSSKFGHVSLDSSNFIDLAAYFIPDNISSWPISKLQESKHHYFYINKPNFKDIDRANKISKISKIDNSYTTTIIKDIVNIYLDDMNTFWVCTKSGLYCYDKADFNLSPKHYFENFTISSIAKDGEDNYWVTTTENGILFIPSFGIHTLQNHSISPNKEKITISLPFQQNILFGSSTGEIRSISNNFETSKLFQKTDKTQFSFGSSGKSFAFLNNIMFDINNSTKPIITFGGKSLDLKILELKNGHFLCLKNRGFLVATNLNEDINKRDTLGKSLITDSNSYFFKKAITACEHKKTIWLGTITGLYSIFNYQYDQIHYEGAKDSLLQNRINDIKADNYDNLWMATIGEGLLCKTVDTVFQLTKENGLCSDLINRTFIENDSTLWVATNNGLNKLIYKCEDGFVSISNIESYNTTDGLLTNFINDITKWKDYIWLATNKGINYFSPNSLSKTAPPPPIILEEITVNDSLLKIDEYPDLNYSQNDLYFKFTGISYRKATDKPFYRYRIMNENTDSTWYYTNNRDVRFNDLQAGKYTFEAAAQNKYGQWSEKPIIYQFSISPHFTRTWWFLILCIIAVISSIVFMVQSRSKRIKLKEEQKRKLQEAELKTKDAELQALRNQMNPHFVFNALNSIQNFVFKNDAKKANYYLSRFSKLMRDGLQFARLKYILLEEEIVFLNTYLELEKMRFPDKFLYNVKVDDHIPINRYYIPPLLFQPILENAVKHAFKNIDYEGSLEIHFEEKIPGEILKITIIDNGEGINPNSVKKHTKSKNKSLGLEIISNQIALLNSEGKDNKASFKIFNRKSIDPQLYGTQAEFIISIKFSEND